MSESDKNKEQAYLTIARGIVKMRELWIEMSEAFAVVADERQFPELAEDFYNKYGFYINPSYTRTEQTSRRESDL